MHALVELARRSVETYIRQGRSLDLPPQLSPEMTEKTGAFVCIKKHGQLRGCIGTFMPTCRNAAAEIIRNAIAAATQDPRFGPVTEQELDALEYTVDLLDPPEPVHEKQQLDPAVYGVIVSSGGRRGLLLPDLEGVDTVEKQLDIARAKAGILPGETCEIFRFRVRRFS